MRQTKRIFVAAAAIGVLTAAMSVTVLAEENRDFPLSSIADAETNAQEPSEGPLEDAFDNDSGTIFHSTWSQGTPDTGPHWIQVDLGTPQDVAGVRFLPRTPNYSNCPTDCDVMGSVDGVSWYLIVHSNTSDSAPWTEWRECAVDYAGQKSRYVRFIVNDTYDGRTNGDSVYFAISEFRVMRSKLRPVSDAEVSDITENSAVLHWKSAYPAGDIIKYTVYKDGAAIVSLEETGIGEGSEAMAYSLSGLNPSNHYTYSIVSESADGRNSDSVEISFDTLEVPEEPDKKPEETPGGGTGKPNEPVEDSGSGDGRQETKSQGAVHVSQVRQQAAKTGDSNTAMPLLILIISGLTAAVFYKKIK